MKLKRTFGEKEDMINLAMFAAADQVFLKEAIKIEKWRNFMNLEIESIEKNDTCKLRDLPIGGKKFGVKWMQRTKLNDNREIDKYKASLMEKCYAQ